MGFLFQISNTGFVSWLQCCCCCFFLCHRVDVERDHSQPDSLTHTFPRCPLDVRPSSCRTRGGGPTPGRPRPHVAPPAVQCLPPEESGSVSFTFSHLISSKIDLFSGKTNKQTKQKQKPVQLQLGSTSEWTLTEHEANNPLLCPVPSVPQCMCLPLTLDPPHCMVMWANIITCRPSSHAGLLSVCLREIVMIVTIKIKKKPSEEILRNTRATLHRR